MKTRMWIGVVIATAFVCACAERLSTPSGAEGVLTGRWGGDPILLVLTETGGTVEFDCARGMLLEALRADGEGRFTATGNYVAGAPGPARCSGKALEALPKGKGEILVLRRFND